MIPLYSNKSSTVEKIITDAENGKTVIPNIQRPYIWKPSQLAKFIDSLLHGWPCGTLLFWETEKEQGIFSTRKFCMGFTEEDDDNSQENSDDYFNLVLDGQQRLQSLIIALSDKSQGYTCSCKEWGNDIGNNRGNNQKETKYLCMQLDKWKEDIDNQSFFYGDYDDPEEAILFWHTKQEIENSGGMYIKISDIACDVMEYSKSLDPTVVKWAQDHMRSLKKLEIPILNVNKGIIEHFNENDYEDTIVNIFTRLNTSGTPLTKEQIQAAQIKSKWPEFMEYLENFKVLMGNKRIDMETDDIVNGFNILLKAYTTKEKLKDIYEIISNSQKWSFLWGEFQEKTIKIIDSLENRGVRHKLEFRSLYVLWFPVVLSFLTERLETSKKENEDDLLDTYGQLLVKWVFVTNWAKIWANRSNQFVSKYTKYLIDLSKKINSDLTTTHDCIAEIQNWLADNNLQKSATDTLDTLTASSRGSVRNYYNSLWVWSRLDKDRAEWLYKLANDKNSFDVDHIVPISWIKDEKYKPDFNSIGNCWLLASNANSIKSDLAFTEFVANYNDPDMLKNITQKIDCKDAHTNAQKDEDLTNLISCISEREESIKNTLKEYVTNNIPTLHYPDIDNMTRINYQHNTQGIYKGDEYINSTSFKKLTTIKSQQSYLSYVRTTSKELGITELGIPGIQGGEIRPWLSLSVDELEALRDRNDVPKNTTSGWKKYINFLINPDAEYSKHSKRNTNKIKKFNHTDNINITEIIQNIKNKFESNDVVNLSENLHEYILAQNLTNYQLDNNMVKIEEEYNNYYSYNPFLVDKNKIEYHISLLKRDRTPSRREESGYEYFNRKTGNGIPNDVIGNFIKLLQRFIIKLKYSNTQM
ncbi:MAG: DUF262 domain-containing protein [Akkermansia sp.]